MNDAMSPLYQYNWPCIERSVDIPATPIVAIVGEWNEATFMM